MPIYGDAVMAGDTQDSTNSTVMSGSTSTPESAGSEISSTSSKKRGVRACDLCRRSKIRCERSSEERPCMACSATGTECVVSGPIFKRGPPKGYIQALEQRWYRSESILAVLMSSPHPAARAVVGLLQEDPLAREVLQDVNVGPLGASGRAALTERATMNEVLSYLAQHEDSLSAYGAGRVPSRHSRATREEVSSQTPPMSFQDLGRWQDRLSAYLAFPQYPAPPNVQINTQDYGYPGDVPAAASHSALPMLSMSPLYSTEPAHDRLFSPSTISETVDAFGYLSVDENQQLRYHGRTSDLSVVGSEQGSDGRSGIWQLPSAGTRCAVSEDDARADDVRFQLPSGEEQEHLVTVYFTHVHPIFPLISKRQFMQEFRNSLQGGTPPPETQSPWKSLLFAVFALAERYNAAMQASPPVEDPSRGRGFAQAARQIQLASLKHSHPWFCQALILMSVGEFVIEGSSEQAYIFSGNAIRMAYALGLHRDPAKWRVHGEELFSEEEKQSRRVTWWACCIVDRRLSVFLGRPIQIQESDHDVALPTMVEDEEAALSQAMGDHPAPPSSMPTAQGVAECFRATASLSAIIADIVRELYATKSITPNPLGTIQVLDARLTGWYTSLPASLLYHASAQLATAPPHVIMLHIEYWYAVMILHRAILPKELRGEVALHRQAPTQDMIRHLERCQTAAAKISYIVDVHREVTGLRFNPPFLTSHILSAGVTHVLLLGLRPMDEVASRGLAQCLIALQSMEAWWPSAEIANALLKEVKQRFLDHRRVSPGADPYRQGYVADPLHSHTMAQMLGLNMTAMSAGAGMAPPHHAYGWVPEGMSVDVGGPVSPIARASTSGQPSAPFVEGHRSGRAVQPDMDIGNA